MITDGLCENIFVIRASTGVCLLEISAYLTIDVLTLKTFSHPGGTIKYQTKTTWKNPDMTTRSCLVLRG